MARKACFRWVHFYRHPGCKKEIILRKGEPTYRMQGCQQLGSMVGAVV
jgi:hypothetical protein